MGILDEAIKRAEALVKEIESGKLLEEVLNEVYPEIESYLKQCVDEAVDAFYGTYSPRYYNRTEGLKEMWEVKRMGKGQFRTSFDGNLAGGYHQNSEIIFQNVMMQGYHGGSGGKGADGIQWRRPYKKYTEWGRSAPRTSSPYDEAITQFDSIWYSYLKPKGENVLRQLGRERLYM